MKRTISIILAITLCLGLAAGLTACGKNDILGTWSLKVSADDLGSLAASLGSEVELVLTFNEDGSAVYSALGMDFNGTYTTDGDNIKIVLSISGSEQTLDYTYRISGDELILSNDSGEQIFTRSK